MKSTSAKSKTRPGVNLTGLTFASRLKVLGNLEYIMKRRKPEVTEVECPPVKAPDFRWSNNRSSPVANIPCTLPVWQRKAAA